MTMTDPVADMLTRLRNANSAYHDTVAMPHSKIKVHIAEILEQEGYISGWQVQDAEVGKKLVVDPVRRLRHSALVEGTADVITAPVKPLRQVPRLIPQPRLPF